MRRPAQLGQVQARRDAKDIAEEEIAEHRDAGRQPAVEQHDHVHLQLVIERHVRERRTIGRHDGQVAHRNADPGPQKCRQPFGTSQNQRAQKRAQHQVGHQRHIVARQVIRHEGHRHRYDEPRVEVQQHGQQHSERRQRIEIRQPVMGDKHKLGRHQPDGDDNRSSRRTLAHCSAMTDAPDRAHRPR